MATASTELDYVQLARETDPWASIPTRYNLGHALTRGNVEAGRGSKVCLRWENSLGDTRQFTYAEMDEASSRLASALTQLGVKRGDRVLLRMPNLPEFYVAALGIAKLGAIFIPSSTQFRASEIAYRLRDSQAVAVITTTGLADEVEAARADAPDLKHLITIPYLDVPAGEDQLDFWPLVDDGDADFAAIDTASDEVAFIAYTSGTTGDPKGVVHYHRYPIAYDSLIEYWHDFREDDVCACPAELGWLLPVASTFLYAMRQGIEIVLFHSVDGRFRPEDWFEIFQKYAITNFVATPTIFRMLTAHADIGSADLSALRHGTSAGEPLPPDTIASVQQHMGFEPVDGLGMSECMVYCFNMVGMSVKPGSCGRPAPGAVIEIMDDDLKPVPAGTPGVLCLRRDTHPGIMKEYWNKPEQTAEMFRGDWYVSGDVLLRDDEGYFWFKGRNDDVINASGYRISPFEVESCLVSHPAVLEAAAVQSPDPIRGMIVKAYLVLREGHKPSESLATDIQSFAKQAIAPYKYPRQIEFVASLPKTTSGKIIRKQLRQQEDG
jgi:acetyl-CoA synthetase